uniref:DUF1640 domain-containing protein n=1 Tax=Candidatus Kentrum sp. FM TaxID=2126340 RepID=A0A450WCD3_9GAMM|nr:MAG: hypothetical protein BECKFM1743A_GA0114220_103306 [Candidatus Kentron sp. FM]VFJ68613.1 MAG: hypothetical protein BECKFM1743C_GA0114222_104921 [Candidatus Kentron sp. FM]VFK14700.1 MAG: hypothetical protein BECKFM1743B_GA0114221_103356 [Candidatus Kentron sp. FM]
MTAITFDTLRFVRTLKDADFNDKQAEAISSAFQDAQHESDLATKADIRVVETKIEALETKIEALNIKVGALARDINSLRWILGVIVVLTVIPLIDNLLK